VKTRVVHLNSAEWAAAAPSERVRIDRRSKWGNPFRIGVDGDRAQVIALYRASLRELPTIVVTALRAELRGKMLGCWCAPLPCHGDVLAAVAEGEEP